MPSDADIEARFWKELKASPFVMLGLNGSAEAHGQPMTAFFDDEHAPFWFFTSRDNSIVKALSEGRHAIANYVGKGHDLFASIHGTLSIDNDRATIDRLWNGQVEAWFEGGKSDPKLTLIRLDADRGEFWLNSSSIGAAISRLFGNDPKQAAKDNKAEVAL